MARRTTKRIILLLGVPAVLSLAVLGAYLIRNAHRQSLIEQSLAEGTAAYKAAKYEEVMDKLGYYVGKNRSNGEAIYMLADARRKTPKENSKHLLEAIPFARLAVDALPGDPRPLEMLLDLYGQVGFVTEQGQVAEKLLKLDPTNREALMARAYAFANIGKTQDAENAALERVRLYPNDVEAYAEAVHYKALNRTDPLEIVRFIDDAADAHPQSGRFLALKALTLTLGGEADSAVAAARAAAEVKAESAAGVAEVLAVLDRLSRVDSNLIRVSEQFVTRELAGPLGPEVAVVAAERAWRDGRLDAAMQSISLAVDSDNLKAASDDALGWATYFKLLRAGKITDPSLAAELAELRSRSAPRAKYWTAVVEAQDLLLADKHQEGRKRLLAARAINPDSELVEYMDADVDQRVGEWRRAADRWANVVARLSKRGQNWRMLNISLTTLYLQHRDVVSGVEAARAAVSTRPGNAEIMLLARAYAMLVESDQANSDAVERIDKFAEELAKSPMEDPVLQSLTARMFLAVGKQEQAETIIRQLVERDPAPPTEVFTSLAAALRGRNAALAEQVLARARVDADTPDLTYQSALQLASRGSVDQGRELLERALEAHKSDQALDYSIRLAAYMDFTRSPEAADFYRTLAEKHLKEPSAQSALLDSMSAWSHKDGKKLVDEAIARLRETTGDSGSAWKIYRARWWLTFEPSGENAAEAVRLLAPVIAQDPRNIMAISLDADANVLLNDRNHAIQTLTSAVDAEPDRPTLYPRLIELLQQAGRTDEATRRLMSFSRITRVTPDVQRRRARLLAAQGLWDNALDDFSVLAALGNPEDRFAYADINSRQGKRAKAKPLMDELAQMPQLSEPLALGVANFYGAGGEIDKGRELLEQKLNPETPSYKAMAIAKYLARYRDYEGAEALLIRASQDGTATSLAELGTFYRQQGRLEDAKKVVARGLAAFPSDAQLLQLDGFIKLSAGGSNVAAMEQIVRAMGSLESRPDIQRLAQAIQQFEQSQADAQRAFDASKNPDGQAFAQHQGRLEKIQAEYVAALTTAARDFPASFPVWSLLVNAQLQGGKQREAVESARLAVAAIPVDPEPAQLATQVMLNTGFLEEAVVMADQWRARSVKPIIEPDLSAASALMGLGRQAEALRRLERWRAQILAEADINPGALEQLASALAASGRESDARSLVWPRVEKDDSWSLRALRVSDVLPPAARSEWLTHLEPALLKSGSGRIALGRTLYAIGTSTQSPDRLNQAINTLRPGLEDAATRGPAALLMAGAYEGLGNQQQAIASYRIAVQEVPNDPISLNNLAFLLSGDDSTVGEAVTMAKRAVAASEGSSQVASLRRNFLDTLGFTHLRARQYPQAEAAFRKALVIDSTALDSSVGLAEAALEQGRDQEAQNLLISLDNRRVEPTDPALIKRIAAIRQRVAAPK